MPFRDCFQTRQVKVVPYPIVLNEKMLVAFMRFCVIYIKDRKPRKLCEIRVKCRFDPTQYSNWSSLAHLGLIRKYSMHGVGTDLWKLTGKGEAFYNGEISIYNIAAAWRSQSDGETILSDDFTVWGCWDDTNKTKREQLYIHEIAERAIKTKPDYKEDLISALNS